MHGAALKRSECNTYLLCSIDTVVRAWNGQSGNLNANKLEYKYYPSRLHEVQSQPCSFQILDTANVSRGCGDHFAPV